VGHSCNEGDNNKDADDSNEELVSAVEHDFKTPGAVACESLLEASRSNQPKSYVSCQAQVEGLHHDEELHDHMNFCQKQEARGQLSGEGYHPFA
jgi:hypothetical protein